MKIGFPREAAKKSSFLSVRATKRGRGAKRVCHLNIRNKKFV